MAWYYNLWVSEHNRQPLAKINTIFVNNTEYNFQAGYTVADTSGHFRHDIINNYFITGPADTSRRRRVFPDERQPDDLFDRQFAGQQQRRHAQRQFHFSRRRGPVLTSPWSTLYDQLHTFSPISAYRFDLSSCRRASA